MKCVTGKIGYETEELATEALIQNRIRNNHREGSGPINVYQCAECSEWHFTSKGEASKALKNPETVERIRKERQMMEWSDKF